MHFRSVNVITLPCLYKLYRFFTLLFFDEDDEYIFFHATFPPFAIPLPRILFVEKEKISYEHLTSCKLESGRTLPRLIDFN